MNELIWTLWGSFALITFLNVFYAVLTHKGRKADREMQNKLIKALLAQNVQEYAMVEGTPQDELAKLRTENDLAKHAAKIRQNQERAIPIT